MAVQIILNFEKISMQIIEDEISKMTDDNISEEYEDISPVDDEKFINNLYHGSIAATFIVNLYEASINTIIGKQLEWDEEEILRASLNVKLQIICKMYNVDYSTIKSHHSYALFKKIEKLRNDIIHYKYNEACMGHFISDKTTMPKGTSKDTLAEMFTKSYMTMCYNGVLSLLNLICEKCGLVLNTRCEVIDCDGRDCLCEFIVSQKIYDEGERYWDDGRQEESDLCEV